MPPRKSSLIKLPTKSSTLGRTMTVDLSPLSQFKRFWEKGQSDRSSVWQVLANNYINKPYLDIPWLFRGAYDITHGDFTVITVTTVITSYSIHYTKLYDNSNP
ncbi:hypothetical protein, partial [Legionella tunisiensis]|uniref:hypothetical protein n=1 Tax=Legionella tunisiensis TaxID=1034944 RepID=UPI0012EA1126